MIEESLSPPKKRLRQDTSADSQHKSTKDSRLFIPFRALGLITNHVPFILQTRSYKGATDGPRIHLLTCLGRAWALWEGGKMGLLFVGPDAPEHISSLAMDGDAVWIASSLFAIKYLRGKEVLRVSNPLGSNLTYLTIFGSQLLALDERGEHMLTWTLDGQFETAISFEPGFTAISILHPATYLNKVLVSSSQGSLQLWNIKTRACIHRFPANKLLSSSKLSAPDSHEYGNAITALVQSTAVDVVGVGFTSGEISVYDIRADERLMKMFMEGGGIKALGFRADGHPILASASSAGHIALWDLNEGGRLLHMVRGAHDGAITALEWVPGQPVLITSSEDNSVKQWLFDSPTAAPRLLKFRSGHHAPLHLIRYYGDDGKQLLTTSRDRSLRCTSVVRDSRSFELSQGSLLKKATSLSIPLAALKFPSISSISYSTTRAKDWDDIVTTHSEEPIARSWTMSGKRLGKYNFGFAADPTAKSKSKDKGAVGIAKAVCVTACGNFAVAGSSIGQIGMWNLQSGIKRKTFKLGPCPPETTNRFNSGNAKGRSISGITTDSLNKYVIVTTLDGTTNFFDFQTTKLEHTIILSSTATSTILQRDSGLLAIICDDMTVRLVDIETRRIVRELGGFHGRILDITFSPDSRWIVATSLDSVIRTFDIPTGRLINAFRTPSIATSVAFSPTNDFLATAHVDSVGVFLWANRAQYADVSFQTVDPKKIFDVALPSVQGQEDEGLEGFTALQKLDAPVDVFSTPPQLDGELITLTLLPRSRWQTLLNLDVIQQRNKPKEPPKAPEKAPFFLPTLPGIEPRFAPEAKDRQKENKKSTKLLVKSQNDVQSTFIHKLVTETSVGDYEGFFNYAKTLSPAALDIELRSMVTLDHHSLFINALIQRLHSHRDFEAVQAMQNVFLKVHSDILIVHAEMRADLEKLAVAHQKESQRVLELLASSLGTLGFIGLLCYVLQCANLKRASVTLLQRVPSSVPTSMDPEQEANVSAMDESRIDNRIRSIYSLTRNPTTEDFATMLGFMDAQPETMLFANLNEIEKLISCCHLLRKLRMGMPMDQQDIIFHKLAALYLPSLVGGFLEPPSLPSNVPAFMTDESKLNNPYLELIGVISHTPYFSRFLLSNEAGAAGGKRLMQTISERLVALAPTWDRKMINPPPDREHGYYQSAASTPIQLLSTLLVIFVKEPRDSPHLIRTDTETELISWLRIWKRRHASEFLGRVSSRTLGQLTKQPHIMQEVMQMRRLLKNWDVCGKVGCDKTTELKACSRCKTIRYCCPEHQRAHWSSGESPHKAICFKPAYY